MTSRNGPQPQSTTLDNGETAASQNAYRDLDLESAPWPFFADDEVAAVQGVLRSGRVNYWTGNEIERFETEFAAYCDVRHAIAVANGTLALDLALTALGIGAGDEVVVTPRSYFASTSSVVLAGATPVFVDVDRDSQNITAASIEKALTASTRAVMPVHLSGWPCPMPEIMDLATSHGLAVIEDCAQAHGARVNGRSVGSFGDVAAFSFCQDKIISTGGEGGMLLTDDDSVWQRAWSFKDHGKSYDAVHRDYHPPGFRWLHEDFGSNFRLTEMQAAIGRVQLGKLPGWVRTRQRHAGVFREVFAGIAALRTPAPGSDVEHAYYKFYTFLRPEALRAGWDRDRVIGTLGDRGVPCFSGSCPEIYREKALQSRGIGPDEPLPVARELGETSLMLQVHPTLTSDQVAAIADAVASVVAAATR